MPFGITLSSAAKDYLAGVCTSEDKPYVHLSVKGGGCAGFSYKWDFTDGPQQNDEIIDITDSHKLVIDGLSVLYLTNMDIDYKRDIAGATLQLNNPNVASSCGCGESFSSTI